MMYDLEEFHALERSIVQIASGNLEPQTLLLRIAARLGEAFGVDCCAIVAAPDRGVKALSGFWRAEEASAWREAQIESQLLALSDRAGREALMLNEAEAGLSLFRAWLSQPLGERGGWLGLGSGTARSWHEVERESLQHLAAAIALLCDRSEFQQQVLTYQRYQTLIGRLGHFLHTASELEPSLESALAETAVALQVDRAWLMTLKYADPLQKNRRRAKLPKAKVSLLAHWSAQTERIAADSTFALADCSPCARAWQNAPALLAIADLDATATLETLPPLFAAEPMKAWLLVPLVGRSGSDAASLAVGFLLFQARCSRVWRPEELDLARWVGEQLSAAMLQNQAQRQVQAMVEERTAQLRWSLELQAKLSEKMRVQIDELKRANQIKDEFLATVQDELKHPLAKMKMAIEMLKIAPDTQRRQRYLEILETECAKETKSIVDLLTLQQLRSQRFDGERQQLNIEEIIARATRTFEQRTDKGLTLEVDNQIATHSAKPSPTLFADVNSIDRILNELLSNAWKFAHPNTCVRLSVSARAGETSRYIAIVVTNTGIGIPPEKQQEIFKPFTQIRRREGTEQGTGLGLALVRALVEHLNGTIEVCSLPTKDSSAYVTSFTLTLPQSQPSSQFWEVENE